MRNKTSLKQMLLSALGLRISLAVFVSILFIEAIILFPSYANYERDLLLRLSEVGRSSVDILLPLPGQNSSLAERNMRLEKLFQNQRVLGVAIVSPSDKIFFRSGEVLGLEAAINQAQQQRTNNGRWYDVYWSAVQLGDSNGLALRLDAAWVSEELTAFVWRILGLVLLISTVVTVAAILIVARLILMPVFDLSRLLITATDDVEKIDDLDLQPKFNDEIGEMTTALKLLLTSMTTYRRLAVEASDDRFRDFADAASDWFWEMDAELRFCFFSDRFEEVTGVKPVELLGKTREETGIPGVDLESWQRHLHDLRNHLAFRNFVHPRSLRDGSVIQLSVSGRPHYDVDGIFRGFRGTGSDISEIKRIEEELVEAKEVAELADRTKSEFLANMSHELRTPLNAILGFSEMIGSQLLGQLGNPKYIEYAGDIGNSGRHLLDIINDILDLSKIESGKEFLEESVVEMHEVISASIRLVSERANQRGILVVDEITTSLPDFIGDARKLKQIIINLLTNSVKYSDAGTRITIAGRIAKNGNMEITVLDQGHGIAPDNIPRVVKPFGQVRDSAVTNSEGTGLGLPLAVAHCRLHGGELDIESKLGEGTKITITLPSERVLQSCGPLPQQNVLVT